MVRIDARDIVDASSFHSAFAVAFGFPDFYGRNMDAWIDCLSYLDDPDAGMCAVHVAPGQCLSLVIENADGLKKRCPDLFEDLIECCVFVNWRRIETGQPPVLALAFYA